MARPLDQEELHAYLSDSVTDSAIMPLVAEACDLPTHAGMCTDRLRALMISTVLIMMLLLS